MFENLQLQIEFSTNSYLCQDFTNSMNFLRVLKALRNVDVLVCLCPNAIELSSPFHVYFEVDVKMYASRAQFQYILS